MQRSSHPNAHPQIPLTPGHYLPVCIPIYHPFMPPPLPPALQSYMSHVKQTSTGSKISQPALSMMRGHRDTTSLQATMATGYNAQVVKEDYTINTPESYDGTFKRMLMKSVSQRSLGYDSDLQLDLETKVLRLSKAVKIKLVSNLNVAADVAYYSEERAFIVMISGRKESLNTAFNMVIDIIGAEVRETLKVSKEQKDYLMMKTCIERVRADSDLGSSRISSSSSCSSEGSYSSDEATEREWGIEIEANEKEGGSSGNSDRVTLGHKLKQVKKVLSLLRIEEIDEDENVVVMEGSKDVVERTKHIINFILHDSFHYTAEQIAMPKGYHRFLVGGPEGIDIGPLNGESNVEVLIPSWCDNFDVLVYGESADAMDTAYKIWEIYQDLKTKYAKLSVQLTRSRQRFVLGVRGEFLQEIFDATHVSVVPPCDESHKAFTLMGHSGNLHKATAMIFGKTSSLEKRKIALTSRLSKFIFQHNIKLCGKILARYPDMELQMDTGKDRIVLIGYKLQIQEAISSIITVVEKLESLSGESNDHTATVAACILANQSNLEILPIANSQENISLSIAVTTDAALFGEHTAKLASLDSNLSSDYDLYQAAGQNQQEFTSLELESDIHSGITECVTCNGMSNIPIAADDDDDNNNNNNNNNNDNNNNTIGLWKDDIIWSAVASATQTAVAIGSSTAGDIIRSATVGVDSSVDQIITYSAEIPQPEGVLSQSIYNKVMSNMNETSAMPSKSCCNKVISNIIDTRVVATVAPMPITISESSAVQQFSLYESLTKQQSFNSTSDASSSQSWCSDAACTKISMSTLELSTTAITPKQRNESSTSISSTILQPLTGSEAVDSSDSAAMQCASLNPNLVDYSDALESAFASCPVLDPSATEAATPAAGDSVCIDCTAASDIASVPRAPTGVAVEQLDDIYNIRPDSMVTLACKVPIQHHQHLLDKSSNDDNAFYIAKMHSVAIRFPDRNWLPYTPLYTSTGIERESGVEDCDGQNWLQCKVVNEDQVLIYGQFGNCLAASRNLLDIMNFTLELTVPNELHRHIIGSKGRRIQQLMTKFKVQICIPPLGDQKSDSISLKGTKWHVMKARSELVSLLERLRGLSEQKDQRSHVLELRVDPRYHAKLIGRGGVDVNKIKHKHNVQIDFSKKGSPTPDLVRIRGAEDSALAAGYEILTRVAALEKQHRLEFQLDARTHSRLIGYKGDNILKIMTEFDVEVKFPGRISPNPTLVVIIGELNKVQECRVRLEALSRICLKDIEEIEMLKKRKHTGVSTAVNGLNQVSTL